VIRKIKREKQVQVALHTLGPGLHDHALGSRGGAGRDQSSLTFDFDEAGSACAGSVQARVVA